MKNFDDGEVKVTARNYKGDVQHAVQLSVADAINLRTHLLPSTDGNTIWFIYANLRISNVCIK